MPSMQATASRASKKLKIKKVKIADVENMGKTRVFPLSKEKKHMTQDDNRKERIYDAKNGTNYRIETVATSIEEDSSVDEELYSRFRDSIKKNVDRFLYLVWNPKNPTSQIASYEEIEKTLQATNYIKNWRQIFLALFNLLQSIEALFDMEFIPDSTAVSLSADAIFPIFMLVAEHKKADSYLDDVMILTERIKELER